jgi:hypothetical protein
MLILYLKAGAIYRWFKTRVLINKLTNMLDTCEIKYDSYYGDTDTEYIAYLTSRYVCDHIGAVMKLVGTRPDTEFIYKWYISNDKVFEQSLIYIIASNKLALFHNLRNIMVSYYTGTDNACVDESTLSTSEQFENNVLRMIKSYNLLHGCNLITKNIRQMNCREDDMIMMNLLSSSD